MHKIEIEKMKSGVLAVKVGCQIYFYQTQEALQHELNNYLADPGAASQRMMDAKIEYDEMYPDRMVPEVAIQGGTITNRPEGIGIPVGGLGPIYSDEIRASLGPRLSEAAQEKIVLSDSSMAENA